jgi:hypothetical protein
MAWAGDVEPPSPSPPRGVRLARRAGQHSLQKPLEVSPFSAWVPLNNDAEAIESHTTGGWRGDT